MSESKITVTVKHQGKDAPWLVFHGSPPEVKALMTTTFGISGEGLTLHELTVTAQQLVNAVGQVSKVLGGTPVPDGDPAPNAWDKAGSAPATPPPNPLFAALDAAKSQDEVKVLWAHNRMEFEGNADLDAAMKKRYQEVAA